MKVDTNDFLSVFYALLKDDDISSINILDMVEIVKIIYSSEDFELMASRLKLDEFDEEVIINNKYTLDIDENGIISFDIEDKDKKELIKNNKIISGFIEQAIQKRAMAKYMNRESNGLVSLKYDSPNGKYNLPYVNQFDNKCQACLFTDGDYTEDILQEGEEYQTYTRNVKIDNSTYSIMVTFIDNKIDNIEVRSFYYADYNFVLEETKKILNGNIESYNKIIDNPPKAYRFKRH